MGKNGKIFNTSIPYHMLWVLVGGSATTSKKMANMQDISYSVTSI